MMIHIAGAGCPDPSGDRFGTCIVLDVLGQTLMFDCGPAATYKLARIGIRPTQISRLFFTHHHFDHNCDYPCFLLSRWDQGAGKEPRLHVYGPPPTKRFTERLIGAKGAFVDDWKARVDHPASQALHKNRGGTLPRPAPKVDVEDVGPGAIYEDGDLRVTAASVHHVEPSLKSLAYRVESTEPTVVLTGDAGRCDALGELARGADVLVMCCAYSGDIAPEVADVVTGATDAANIAREAGASTLVLTHTTPGMGKPGRREAVVGEIARIYEGRIIFADEMLSLAIP